MGNFTIFTNNPAVKEKYGTPVHFKDLDVKGIFIAVRDAVHKGAVLISHPLSGSIKPNESPYKSIVLSMEQGMVDNNSLALIEGALCVLAKMPEKCRNYPAKVLDDFQVIDLDLMDSAMAALPAKYY